MQFESTLVKASNVIYKYYQLQNDIEMISIDLDISKKEVENILSTFKNTFAQPILNIQPNIFVEIDPNVFPDIFVKEFQQLRELYETKQYYGVFLQVKDICELLLKYPVIIYISILAKNKGIHELSMEEREMFQFFLGNQLSLGSWQGISNHITNHLQNTEKEYEVVANILKSINTLYKENNIVKWRNDHIGHGALMSLSNQKFKDKLSEYINIVSEYIQSQEIQELYRQLSLQLNEKKWEVTITDKTIPMEPFFQYKEALYMIDSFEKSNHKAYYLDYESGDKYNEKSPALKQRHEELEMFFQREESISSIQGDLTHIFVEDKERLKKLLYVEDYYKPNYLYKALYQPIKELTKGILHLQMEEGMGKTSFIQAIDPLANNNKHQQQFSNGNLRACYLQSYVPNQMDDLKMQLLEGLKKIEVNGEINEIRISENIPERLTKDILLEWLEKYRDIHQNYSGKPKLVVVFDGLDELHSSEEFMEMIPAPEELPDSVFIIFTSRLGTMKPDFTALSKPPFIYPSDCKENKALIREFIQNKLNNTTVNVQEVVTLIDDYRFIYVRNFMNIAILQKTEVLSLEQLIPAYCKSLLHEYGEKYAIEIQKLLALLTHIPVPLSLEQISQLIYDRTPDYGLIGLLHDIRGWLRTNDTNQTRTYILSHDQLRILFKEVEAVQKGLKGLEEKWVERLNDVNISKDNPTELLIILKYLKQLLPDSYCQFKHVLRELAIYYYEHASTSNELTIARDLLYQYIHTFNKQTELEAVYTLECAYRTSQFEMMIELQNKLISNRVNKEPIPKKLADPDGVSIRTLALAVLSTKGLPNHESFIKTMKEIQRHTKATKNFQNPILFLQSDRPNFKKIIDSLPRLHKDSYFYYEHLKYRFAQFGLKEQYRELITYGKKVISYLSDKKAKQPLTLIERETEANIRYLMVNAYFGRFTKNLSSGVYDEKIIQQGHTIGVLMGQKGYDSYKEAYQFMLEMMDYYEALIEAGEWNYAEVYLIVLKNCYTIINKYNLSLNYKIEIIQEMRKLYKKTQSQHIKLNLAFEQELVKLIFTDRSEEEAEFENLKKLMPTVEKDDLDSYLVYVKEHPSHQTDAILKQLCLVKYAQLKNLSSIPSKHWQRALEPLFHENYHDKRSITDQTAGIICVLIAICEYEHSRSSSLSEYGRYESAQHAAGYSNISRALKSKHLLEQDLIDRGKGIFRMSYGTVLHLDKKFEQKV